MDIYFESYDKYYGKRPGNARLLKLVSVFICS